MSMFSKDNAARAGAFFRRNGFYIALALCIAALGVAAVLTLAGDKDNGGSAQESEIAQVESLKDQTVESVKDERTGTMSVAPGASPSPSPSPSPQASAAPQTVKKAPTVVMKSPLADGRIIRECSIDKLVYNRTLNQWSTHNGVDISGETGAEVYAALSGTVSSVYSNSVMGDCIVVDCAQSGKTLYAGVLPAAGIAEGKKLNTGELLGTLSSVPFEEFSGSHLHFEYSVSGKLTDPAPYFAK